MKTRVENIREAKPYEQKVQKRFGNYMLMLSFAIGSISILFVTLTFTYAFSRGLGNPQTELVIPPIFYIDTAILAFGSLSLYLANRAYRDDNSSGYKIWIYGALMAGITFLIGQILGWYALSHTGFTITGHRASAFLYVISGVHALHIIGGIVCLGYLYFIAADRLKDPSLSIVYFTDPVPKAQLRLVNVYWHFLGLLWLYLLVFFTIVR